MKRLGRMLQLLPNEQRVVIALVVIIVAMAAYLRHERKVEERLPLPAREQSEAASPSPPG